MVWVKRFEVVMLIVAYVFTFFIVLTSAIVSKGTTLFIISQVLLTDRLGGKEAWRPTHFS